MNVASELRAAQRALAWNVLEGRRVRKFTVEAASFEAGLAPRHWSAIEAGQSNPTLSTIVRVAVALRVDIPALFAPVGR